MDNHPIAEALRQLADALDTGGGMSATPASPPPGSARPLGRLRRPAPPTHTPSAPWETIQERALTKSLQSLRVEAVQAVAAFHLVHQLGAAIYRERAVASLVALRESDDAEAREVVSQLGPIHAGWVRDEAVLAQALRMVAEIEVPDATAEQVLDLDEGDLDVALRLADTYAATIERELLVEREG